MAYKILTPKELLAQTLAQAKKQTTTGYVDPNASKVPTTTAALVTPAPTGGFTSFDAPKTNSEKAILAQFYGADGAATTGTATTAAIAANAQYQQSATNAANNALDAQVAQQDSIINSGGIWAALQPIAEKQMNDSIASLTAISTTAKANVESSRVALNAQDAADYAKVIETLDQAVISSRQQTTEQMNQRGMFFSTVLDSVMGQVNAAYTTQKGQAAQQDKASLAKIASDMAVLSGNIDIETIKGNASAVAQYTASMLSVVAQDAQTKQTAQALLASLNVQKAGVVDTIAAQVFTTQQQVLATAATADANTAATAFNQQEQLKADAANASNTAFTQNLQTNAATADATTAAQQEFVNTMGQYANDYQAAANALDPNDPLYAFKEGMLESAHNQKASATTAAQAAAVLQAAKDKAAAAQQTFDNLIETAKVNISGATQQATAAYQSGQLNVAQYNAATSRINSGISQQNANTSAYNATKPTAGAAGGGLTYTQAMGNIDDYTKLQTTLGNLTQGADGKWYTTAPNTAMLSNAQLGNTVNKDALKIIPATIPVEVNAATLKQQIAELEPAYRASIAVRDKTSGTTTPLPIGADDLADVVGFIKKVDEASGGQNRGAWANELLSKLPAGSLSQAQLTALDNYFNKGDRSVYNGS